MSRREGGKERGKEGGSDGGREGEMEREREWERRGRERGDLLLCQGTIYRKVVVFYCFIRLVVSYNQFNGSLASHLCVRSQIIIGSMVYIQGYILNYSTKIIIMIACLVVEQGYYSAFTVVNPLKGIAIIIM